jgi:hypothetical protein
MTVTRNPDAAERVFLDARRCTEDDLRALAALPHARMLQLTGLRITPAALAAASWVESLHLVDPATIEGLENVQQIRTLSIYHLPKIHDLAPIGHLRQLRTLRLSTPPGYDASRKCFEVASLEPLGRLTNLEALTMRGIVPLSGGLEPLHRLQQLQRLDITHVYAFALEDYARLARALPNTTGHCLQPFFAASWAGKCSRCAGDRVVLTAPPPRHSRFLCPVCNRARLDEHVAAWNRS